jgi:hypothetical protein
MRKGVIVFALCAVLVPSTSGAGRPEPMECPADVAAAMVAECPCEGVAGGEGEVPAWRNHGQYVRCVAHHTNDLRKADCLTPEVKRDLKRCAARSTCGKEGRVLCCFTMLDTCSGDLVPGDALAEGTCTADAEVLCDTDADCTKTKARIANGEEACTAEGGVAAGAGSVCAACETPAL